MTARTEAAANADHQHGRLTAAQRQMWTLDRLTGTPEALNLSYALLITGPLDIVALEGAFRDVVRAHEPLRTTYPAPAGEPVATVVDEAVTWRALRLDPVVASGLPEVARLARQDRIRGFDLAHEAPVRAELFALVDGDSDQGTRHVLLLTLHHIAADGWSLHTMNLALSRSYAARTKGLPSASAAPTATCTELAEQQHTWLAGPDADKEFDWWSAHLWHAKPDTGLPDGAHDGTGAEMLRTAVRLPDELVAEVRTLARAAVVSPFVVLLTAFQVMLQRWTGTEEPVLGTLSANRPSAQSASVLGAHYNPLLISTDLSGDPSMAECLLRTSATMLGALDHQRMPYSMVVERLTGELGWTDGPPPQAMFLMDKYPMDDLRLAGCEVTGLHLDEGYGGSPAVVAAATPARLTMFVREVGQRMTLSAVYPRGVLTDAAAADALSGYQEILANLCDTPEMPLSAVEWSGVEDAPEPASAGSTPPPLGEHTLRPVTDLAPVEVLSPVGIWASAPGCRSSEAVGQKGRRSP